MPYDRSLYIATKAQYFRVRRLFAFLANYVCRLIIKPSNSDNTISAHFCRALVAIDRSMISGVNGWPNALMAAAGILL